VRDCDAKKIVYGRDHNLLGYNHDEIVITMQWKDYILTDVTLYSFSDEADLRNDSHTDFDSNNEMFLSPYVRYCYVPVFILGTQSLKSFLVICQTLIVIKCVPIQMVISPLSLPITQ
jgi:hypothetical protein